MLMKTIDMRELVHAKFGEYIRDMRKELNISQFELAEQLGWSQVYLSYIERGERDVDFGDAFAICHALGKQVDDFLKYFNQK